MTITRITLACSLFLTLVTPQVRADDKVSVGLDAGDPLVTRESANRIEQALRTATECNFKETPLDQALEHFEHRHKIEIWLDKSSLQDEGISTDTHITLTKSGISLEAALRLTLDPLGLTHVTEDGVMKITTQAKADEKLSTRVYPVGDLVTSDYKELIRVVQDNTSGKWMDIDQEGGAINPFRNSRSLVIRQTQHVHREIEGVLAALRHAKKLHRVDSVPANSGEPTRLHPVESSVTRTYSPSRRNQQAPSTYQPPRFFSAGG